MKSITISVPGPNGAVDYPIYLGVNALADIGSIIDSKQYSSVLFVYDKNVKKNWGNSTPSFAAESVMPAQGEKQKRLEILNSLWELFRHKGLDRHSLVVLVGGGALCDVGSFAASTYMRGVAFINVPTTLLSMVDSSIGGKNGINVGEVKNLVGTFAQPRAVVVDPTLLTTLPPEELTSGFAEVIKHGLIADAQLVNDLREISVLTLSSAELLNFIERSCRIKAQIVMQDPFEANVRKILNFGHTIGHAYEALSYGDTPLLHGQAVGLGMLVESQIGTELGFGSETITETVRELLQLNRLPTAPPRFAPERVLEKIRADKKNRGGKLLFSLLSSVGSCEFDREVSEETVYDVLESVTK